MASAPSARNPARLGYQGQFVLEAASGPDYLGDARRNFACEDPLGEGIMKALFVGLGGVGQRHLRNLRHLAGEGIEVLAWRVRGLDRVLTDSLTVEEGADLQSRYGYKLVPTLEEGLAAKPDLTFVCNPSSLHVPVALAALQAGSHVFIEKPVSDSLVDVDTLIAEADRRARVGYVGYQLRFHPAIVELERLIRTAAVGRLIAVHAEVAEYLPHFHRYEDYRQMYASRRDLGGGVILSQIHELDYLTMLFGLPRRVFALGGHLSRLEVDVEDTATLLMDCGFPDQSVPICLHMDFVQRPSARGCKVVGDAGTIGVDLVAPSLVHYGPDGTELARHDWQNFVRNELFLAQLRHFLAVCRGEEMPRCTLAAAAQSLKVALAARRSLATGAVVEVAA
jgi:predicted dehydrogenase